MTQDLTHLAEQIADAITRLAKQLDVLSLARMAGHRDIRELMTYYNPRAEDLAKLLD